ncbi:pepsin A, putative [Ricinus communis]|uniref:Pepsin A, putative n=2 Tax=Ricinus communis TaxID=3988 RepID=B9RTV6_RICCO|nr:pepsin A, putative [Ricinus communis]
MDSSAKFLLLSLLISFSLSHAQTPSKSSLKPKALVLPITKDSSTLQYLTRLNLGTPLVLKNLVVDLGGQHLWIDCDTDYHSLTYRPGHCGSATCSQAKAFCVSICLNPPGPNCNNNSCIVDAQNSVFGAGTTAHVSLDTISFQSTDGSKAGPPVSFSNFIFGCAHNFSLTSLASGANGMIGLGKERLAFPSQLSSLFGGSLRRKFAICLPSTSKSNGVLFLGDSPYQFYPGYNTSKAIDVSSRLTYTKLHTNYKRTATPRLQGAQVPEYFVKITSILVNRKPIPINTTLLDFHRTGIGGSRITTVKPYTILESSIYDSLVKAFDTEIATWKVKKVAAVEPFRDCYSKGNLAMSPLGLAVPDITFVFENKDVSWDMYGANSMVEISNDVVCLGFLRGVTEIWTTTSIDIGAYQLQDNLVQFDLAASRMAFTNTLLLEEVECSNFNF